MQVVQVDIDYYFNSNVSWKYIAQIYSISQTVFRKLSLQSKLHLFVLKLQQWASNHTNIKIIMKDRILPLTVHISCNSIM